MRSALAVLLLAVPSFSQGRRLANWEEVSRSCSNKKPSQETLYYDTTYLGCRSCDESLAGTNNPSSEDLCTADTPASDECHGIKVPDPATIGNVGVPESCNCQVRYRQKPIVCDADNDADTCIDGFQCIRCPEASSSDRKLCMLCPTDTGETKTQGFDPDKADCFCLADSIGTSQFALVERNEVGDVLEDGKACVRCPDRSRVFTTDVGVRKADPYTCQTCPDPKQRMTEKGNCACDEGYERIGETRCIVDAHARKIETTGGSFNAASQVL